MARRYCLSCGFDCDAVVAGVCPQCGGIVAEACAPTAPGLLPADFPSSRRTRLRSPLALLCIFAILAGVAMVAYAFFVVGPEDKLQQTAPVQLLGMFYSPNPAISGPAKRQFQKEVEQSPLDELRNRWSPAANWIADSLAHSDVEVHKHAYLLLQKLGPAAAPALAYSLGARPNMNSRSEVLQLLVELGPEARPALGSVLSAYASSALNQADRRKCLAVIGVLLNLKVDALIAADPRNFQSALGSKDPKLRAAAQGILEAVDEKDMPLLLSNPTDCDGLLRAFGADTTGSPRAWKVLQAMGSQAESIAESTLRRRDKDEELRACALRYLASRPQINPSLCGTVLDLASGPDGLLRVNAIRSLAHSDFRGNIRAVPTALRGLSSSDAGVRRAAAWVLSELNLGDDAVPLLVKALAEFSGDARRLVAIALTKFDFALADRLAAGMGWAPDSSRPGLYRTIVPPESLPPGGKWIRQVVEPLAPQLQKLLLEVDLEVRRAAIQVLGWTGGVAPEKLRSLLTDDQRAIRTAAANGLCRAGRHDREALPDLVRNLQDPDVDLQLAATRALARAGSDALPLLGESLSVPGALAALGGMEEGPAGEVLSLLERGLKGDSPPARAAALAALGEVGVRSQAQRTRVVDLVGPSLADADASVRLAAVKTLESMGGSAQAALPALLRRIQEEADVRVMAALRNLVAQLGGK